MNMSHYLATVRRRLFSILERASKCVISGSTALPDALHDNAGLHGLPPDVYCALLYATTCLQVTEPCTGHKRVARIRRFIGERWRQNVCNQRCFGVAQICCFGHSSVPPHTCPYGLNIAPTIVRKYMTDTTEGRIDGRRYASGPQKYYRMVKVFYLQSVA